MEFTGELNEEGYSVTECLGGSMELSEEELGLRYQVRFILVVLFSGGKFRADFFWFLLVVLRSTVEFRAESR